MTAASAYRARSRSSRSQQTRERIVRAVRELLAEGGFHEASVERVAERAGISRATLYQHFRSRLDLVDAICDGFDRNPALLELRGTVELDDPEMALAATIALSMRFWSTEDRVLSQLYGVQAIDPAARDLVERQRADRRGEMLRLARNLRSSGRLPRGTGEDRACSLLMVLTSYETFRELRLAGLPDQRLTRELQQTAASLLIA